MDYFQGVVREFLQSDRALFVQDELVIDLDADEARPQGKNLKGRHWICDVAAVNLREECLYLGEVTFSESLQALTTRLQSWAMVWPELCEALARDSGIDPSWKVIPWTFIPQERHELLQRRLEAMDRIGDSPGFMPIPRVTYLEDVVPWKHKSWKGRPSTFDRAAQQIAPADAQDTLRVR